jgi:hypothetical protein
VSQGVRIPFKRLRKPLESGLKSALLSSLAATCRGEIVSTEGP